GRDAAAPRPPDSPSVEPVETRVERERARREDEQPPRRDAAAPRPSDSPPPEPAETRAAPLAVRRSIPSLGSPPSPGSRMEAPDQSPVPAPAPSGIDPHLVSLLEPGTLEAEPYRALRHLVERRRQLTGGGVLVVTSPGMGDGKTTTAINLA